MRHPILLIAMASFAAAPLFLSAAPAVGASLQNGGVAMPDCNRMVAINGRLMRAVRLDSATGGLLPGGRAVIVADQSGVEGGAVAFVRDGGNWRAWSLGEGQVQLKTYRSGQGVFAWSQLQRAGAAPSFEGFFVPATGGARFCVSVDFPRALADARDNLDFGNFNIAGTGRGMLTGRAQVERGGRTRTLFYAYRTRDAGRSWRAPVAVRSAVVPAGRYAPLGSAPVALIRDLQRQGSMRR